MCFLRHAEHHARNRTSRTKFTFFGPPYISAQESLVSSCLSGISYPTIRHFLASIRRHFPALIRSSVGVFFRSHEREELRLFTSALKFLFPWFLLLLRSRRHGSLKRLGIESASVMTMMMMMVIMMMMMMMMMIILMVMMMMTTMVMTAKAYSWCFTFLCHLLLCMLRFPLSFTAISKTQPNQNVSLFPFLSIWLLNGI